MKGLVDLGGVEQTEVQPRVLNFIKRLAGYHGMRRKSTNELFAKYTGNLVNGN
jgi:hypothetical protein